MVLFFQQLMITQNSAIAKKKNYTVKISCYKIQDGK